MPSKLWKTMIGSGGGSGGGGNGLVAHSSNPNHPNNNKNSNNNHKDDYDLNSGVLEQQQNTNGRESYHPSSRGRSFKGEEFPYEKGSSQSTRSNTLVLSTSKTEASTREKNDEEPWYEQQQHHHHTSKKFGFLDRFTMLGNSPSSRDQSPRRSTMIKGKTLNLDHEDFESFNITANFDAETLVIKKAPSSAHPHSENLGHPSFTSVVTTQTKTKKSIPSELLISLERFRVRKCGDFPIADEPSFSDFIRNIQEREDLSHTDKLEILMKQLSQHYVALEYHHNHQQQQQHKLKSTNPYQNEFKPFKNKEISNYCSALGIALAENSQLMINNSLFHTLKQTYEALDENGGQKSTTAADWSVFVSSLVDALKLYLPNAQKLSTFGLLSSIKQLVTMCTDESSTDGDIFLSFHSLMNNLLSMVPDTKYST